MYGYACSTWRVVWANSWDGGVSGKSVVATAAAAAATLAVSVLWPAASTATPESSDASAAYRVFNPVEGAGGQS